VENCQDEAFRFKGRTNKIICSPHLFVADIYMPRNEFYRDTYPFSRGIQERRSQETVGSRLTKGGKPSWPLKARERDAEKERRLRMSRDRSRAGLHANITSFLLLAPGDPSLLYFSRVQIIVSPPFQSFTLFAWRAAPERLHLEKSRWKCKIPSSHDCRRVKSPRCVIKKSPLFLGHFTPS